MGEGGKSLFVMPLNLNSCEVTYLPTVHGIKPFIITPTRFYSISKSTFFTSIALPNYIQEDGSIYITTAYDPLFLLIPTLTAHPSHFQDLQQILITAELMQLSQCSLIYESLPQICEVREVSSNNYYKLNFDMLTQWISHKFTILLQELMGKMPAMAPPFISAGIDNEPIGDMHIARPSQVALKFTLGFFNELLQGNLFEELCKRNGLTVNEVMGGVGDVKGVEGEVKGGKRTSAQANLPQQNRRKTGRGVKTPQRGQQTLNFFGKK